MRRSLAGEDARRPPARRRDGYFKWALVVPETGLYLALRERAGTDDDSQRIAEIHLYGRGPNLGSAGGPTLQSFGAVATIAYVGRLEGPCSAG